MTLAELNEHFTLLEKRNRIAETLDALRSSARPGAAALTGMPRAASFGDRVGDLAAEIADVSSDLDALDREIAASAVAVEAFVREIFDTETRIVFRLRFLRGLSWKEVAGVLGPYVTPDAVKGICYRHLHVDAP